MSYLLQKYISAPNAALLPAILRWISYSSTARQQLFFAEAPAGSRPGSLRRYSWDCCCNGGHVRAQLGIVIALFNVHLALLLAPALGSLFAFGAGLAAYEWRRIGGRQHAADLSVPAVNPLQIPTAFIFASIFVVISVVTAWIRVTFGQTGVLIMAAAIGATDIDPFVINIAQGGVTGLSATMLSTAVLIAASSNNIAKAIYAIAFGGTILRVVQLGCWSFWPYSDLLLQLSTSCRRHSSQCPIEQVHWLEGCSRQTVEQRIETGQAGL